LTVKIRLNKFLAQAGVASRREADRLITQGRVTVNGEVILTLGHKIDHMKDKIEVDGRKIEKDESQVYLMLNKPPGCLVSLKDPWGRPTIKDLLPSLKSRVFPVGRLDYESEGLLLLTNDGELAFRLMHPRFQIKKVYQVKVKGEPDSTKLSRLEKGILLDGKRTAPAKIRVLAVSPKESFLSIEIHEGRKREVRRMFEAVGHRTKKLLRIRFDGLSLGKLKRGKWRYLRPEEIETLKNQVGLESS
jgi:pseudouridine synthase